MKHEFDAPKAGRSGRGDSQATRLRRRARSYLGHGVGGALAGTLGALGERLGQSLVGGREEARVGKQRLEEVLERDRAQRSARTASEARPLAAPGAPAENPAPAPGAGPEASAPKQGAAPAARERDDDLAGVEPIRTRTMARLLAEQGYTKRALAIYDELLARSPDDRDLGEAAARLRSGRSG